MLEICVFTRLLLYSTSPCPFYAALKSKTALLVCSVCGAGGGHRALWSCSLAPVLPLL